MGRVRTGALLLTLAVIMFLPYITGDWRSSNLNSNVNGTR